MVANSSDTAFHFQEGRWKSCVVTEMSRLTALTFWVLGIED